MQRFLFWIVGIVFFIVYFKILQFIYDEFVPMTPFTDVLSLFIIAVVIWPLSALSSQWFIRAVRTAKQPKKCERVRFDEFKISKNWNGVSTCSKCNGGDRLVR